MTTLFGVPLFGAVFVPLIAGLFSIFLLWKIFVSPVKDFHPTVLSNNELLEPNASTETTVVLEAKGKPKEKRKSKHCGGKSGCCSMKDGKSVACSSKSRAIGAAKVFADTKSKICQAYAKSLSTQLNQAYVTSEIIHSSESDITELSEHADGSLCIFLMDNSNLDDDQHCLLKAITNLKKMEKPLTGMKYSVFLFYNTPLIECKVEVIDQLLHKLGGVRVCKAESTHLTSTQSSSHFEDWAEELLSQVQRWNAPAKKACKCGPKQKDQNDESCGSSACSDIDTEDESAESTKAPLLDLEDLAIIL